MSSTAESTPWVTRASCRLWGHHVDNQVFARVSGARHRCRCGRPYLSEDPAATTRVRHTLSCFFSHHTYRRLIDRDGHHEYVCVQCGHPLLFRAESDPYTNADQFGKKVRYLCGLFGHDVERAAVRDGAVEYACHCGHTFLARKSGLATIRHPMVCVLFGHWIRFLTRRAGYSEYVCRHCGHPFCFVDPPE